MKYTDYSVHEFVLDEYFQQWVLNPTAESSRFWEQWLSQYPEKQATVAEARRLVRLIRFNEYPFPQQDAEKIWNKLEVAAMEQKLGKQKKSNPQLLYRNTWFKVAASIVLVMAFALIWWSQSSTSLQYTTAYGETKEVILPDRSVVTLNANSTLTLDQDWNDNTPREVWVDGEAFFEITEQPGKGNAEFTVHSGELDVRVLGTSFNVNNRRGKTSIMLHTGKVQVHLPEGNEEVVMQPGELVEYNRYDQTLLKSPANPQLHSAWKEGEWIFEKTPLYEVANVIQDNYGREVVITDDALKHQEFTGGFPSDNLEIILQSIEVLYDVQIRQQDTQIIINRK
ncbi:MAG: FecR domain-containing protein [Bacteroidota bacterium]